jgi:hypothetical protein
MMKMKVAMLFTAAALTTSAMAALDDVSLIVGNGNGNKYAKSGTTKETWNGVNPFDVTLPTAGPDLMSISGKSTAAGAAAARANFFGGRLRLGVGVPGSADDTIGPGETLTIKIGAGLSNYKALAAELRLQASVVAATAVVTLMNGSSVVKTKEIGLPTGNVITTHRVISEWEFDTIELTTKPGTTGTYGLKGGGTLVKFSKGQCFLDMGPQIFPAPTPISVTSEPILKSLETPRITVSAKVFLPATPNVPAQYIAAKGNFYCDHASYALYFADDSKLKFYIGDSAGFVTSPGYSSSELALNQWHHIVGTFDGSNVNLYVNGNLLGSTSTDKKIGYDTYTSLLTIGYYDCNGAPFRPLMDAKLAELCFFDEAIS